MPQSTELPAPPAREGERIAKLLARAGIASRREIERMIVDGRVAKGGVLIDTPATVLPSLDGVTVDGNPVAAPEPTRLFLYHKPVGLIVTERDPRGRPTIYDRLPPDLPRVVPVGRLDLATEGLLLLTTDGGFKRQLELPATGVERSYRARAYGQVTQDQLESLSEGVEIEGIRYGSIDANLERRTGANMWVELTLTEGKNREVRRVLEYLGLQVSRLIRTRYGPFVLGDLPPGEVGEVRSQNLVNFRRTLKGGAPIEPITAEPRPGFRQAPVASRSARTRTPPQNGEGDRAAKPRGGGGSQSRTTADAAGPLIAGRGSTATHSKRQREQPSRPAPPSRPSPAEDNPRDGRGARPSITGPRSSSPGSPRPDLGIRRGGAVKPKPDERPNFAKPKATTAPTSPNSATPRPPRPQRKTGWAKPKPKTGPARPRRPRA